MNFILLDLNYYMRNVPFARHCFSLRLDNYFYNQYEEGLSRSLCHFLILEEPVQNSNFYYFYIPIEDYKYKNLFDIFVPSSQGENILALSAEERDNVIVLNNIISSGQYNDLGSINLGDFNKTYLKLFLLLLKLKYNIGNINDIYNSIDSIFNNIDTNTDYKPDTMLNYIMINKIISILTTKNTVLF